MSDEHDRLTTITLRALEGTPLAHDRIRGMVEATAHAIAERQGIEVRNLRSDDQSITAVLVTGRLEAMGFAAELRRLTSNWYAHKFGVPELWGEAPDLRADQHEEDGLDS